MNIHTPYIAEWDWEKLKPIFQLLITGMKPQCPLLLYIFNMIISSSRHLYCLQVICGAARIKTTMTFAVTIKNKHHKYKRIRINCNNRKKVKGQQYMQSTLKWLTNKWDSVGNVSILYQYIIFALHNTLPLDRIWRKDIADLRHDFNCNIKSDISMIRFVHNVANPVRPCISKHSGVSLCWNCKWRLIAV